MTIEVETKDCTALGDAELAEMADMCAAAGVGFDIGLLSKQRDDWVLVTQARLDGDLHGFSFCTLERIGGTPSILIGLASVRRSPKADRVLGAMMDDKYRRAVLAFPDEDVLVGSRFAAADAYEAYGMLNDVVPRPDHKASGEERAWGRRLVKRFNVEGTYDDRAFTARKTGANPRILDYVSPKPDRIEADVAAQFGDLKVPAGDVLVTFGWAMADDLFKLQD